jgi:hypothetical protein
MSSTSFNECGGDMIGANKWFRNVVSIQACRFTSYSPAPKLSVKRLELIGRNLLLVIGEDPTREVRKIPPNRFARWWKEFIDYDPGTRLG